MRKMTAKQPSRNTLNAYYKWQFLRRNKDYIEDFGLYDNFLKHNNETPRKMIDDSRAQLNLQLQTGFKNKWDINYPLNPKKNPPKTAKIFQYLFDESPVFCLTEVTETIFRKNARPKLRHKTNE